MSSREKIEKAARKFRWQVTSYSSCIVLARENAVLYVDFNRRAGVRQATLRVNNNNDWVRGGVEACLNVLALHGAER